MTREQFDLSIDARVSLTRARSIAALVVMLVVAGCGSSAPPPPRALAGLKPMPAHASPVDVVRHALEALAHSSFDETNRNQITIDSSGLPAAEAAAVHAKLGQGQTQLFSADVTDMANFTATAQAQGQTIYLKAARGAYSVSVNGGPYMQAPPSEVNPLLDKLQSNLATAGGVIVSARPLGRAVVDGIKVVRYSATMSATTIENETRGALAMDEATPRSNLSGASALEIADVNPDTGLPVRLSVTVRASINLAKQEDSGASGRLVVVDSDTGNYSHVRSHRGG